MIEDRIKKFERVLLVERFRGRFGHTIDEFYREFREVCAPPMVLLDRLPMGSLWWYSGLSVEVSVILEHNSMVLKYGTFPRQRARRTEVLHAVGSWLHDEDEEQRSPVSLQFAGVVDESGRLRVKSFLPGDWVGLPANTPLPPPRELLPSNWEP